MSGSASSESVALSEQSGRPSFIDLFAGCGGLSLGLMNAGWQGILGVERNEMAFETLKHNLIDGRSRGLPTYDWPEWFPQRPISVASFAKRYSNQIADGLRGKVELVAGGPPCQSFSFAGVRSPTDPRNSLWRDYLDVVDLLDAPMVLLENVHGIAVEFGRERAHDALPRPGRPRESHSVRIQRALERRGYRVYQDLVLAANFGVPQLRPRHVLVGLKLRQDQSLVVDPIAALNALREEFVSIRGLPCSRPVTMREAISDLRRAHGTVKNPESPRFDYGVSRGSGTAYQRLMAALGRSRFPDSHRFANHSTEVAGRFRRMLAECRRGVKVSDQELLAYGTHKHSVTVSDPDQPSHTLTTLPDDILHYSEPRILTVREYARLQSIPDRFEFRGKYTTGGKLRTKECPRYTQAGNAVPPLLAEALGGALLQVLPLTACEARIPETSLTPATYATVEAVAEGAKQSQPVGTPAA